MVESREKYLIWKIILGHHWSSAHWFLPKFMMSLKKEPKCYWQLGTTLRLEKDYYEITPRGWQSSYWTWMTYTTLGKVIYKRVWLKNTREHKNMNTIPR